MRGEDGKVTVGHVVCLKTLPFEIVNLSQVTCGDHVKWITDEKSRKDRSVSKGETMSIEKDSDLKRRVRIGRCKENQQWSKGLESMRWRNTT